MADLVKAAEQPTRLQLLRVVEAIELDAPDAEAAVAANLLECARALHLEMLWQLATDVCETITKRLGRHIEETLRLEVVTRWAYAARAAGRLGEAQDRYREVVRLARCFHSTKYVLRGDVGLANILMERGNYPEAESLVDGVIARARAAADSGLQDVLSRALHTRGTVAMSRGRYSEGIAIAREALDLCVDPVEREGILHDIAAGLISLGCLVAARDVLTLVHKTAMDRALRWSASVNLMEIAALEGRAKSFESWQRKLADQRMRPWHRAQFLCLAGEGYERLGQYERALEMYKAAVSAGESLGINEVVIRAEARDREVRAKRYLPAVVGTFLVSRDVKQLIETVTELCMAAGIPAGAEDP